MANRDMDAATLAEVQKNNIVGYELLELNLDGGNHYYTNGPFPTAHLGNTYQSVGNFLAFSDIVEDTKMMISEVTLTLTGLVQSDIAEFLDYEFVDRTARIYRQLWNDVDGIVGTYLIFEGRFKSVGFNDNGETLTIGGTLANQFVDFERTSGRHTNNETQQFHYPGDKFFSFSSEVLKELVWRP